MHRQDVAIAKCFISATKDILGTMAFVSPKEGKPFVKSNCPQEGDISAVIGITGMRKGTISVSFERGAALEILRNMLGDDIHDEQTDMEDVVGELSNMISGQARALLDADGLNMQGSTPTIVTGDGHNIHHTASGPVIAIPFTLGGGTFTVEFCFDATDVPKGKK